MLFGTFRHTIDARNRLFIPVKFREQLGESFVVIRNNSGTDHFLSLYSQEEWENILQRVNDLPRARTTELKRFWGSKGMVATLDTQGRVVLTPELIEYLGMDKNAVIIGCTTSAEIWAEDVYNRREAEEDTSVYEQMMLDLGI